MPRDRFDAARYEGSDADERRLFYVAITRARDWLSVSRHERVTTQRCGASPYYTSWRARRRRPGRRRASRHRAPASDDDPTIEITFSELAAFLDCAHGLPAAQPDRLPAPPRARARLRQGRPPRAAHRRRATPRHRARSRTPAEIDAHPRRELLPADRQQARPPPAQGRRPAGWSPTYAADHADDLHRVWETERPFELHLDGITVSGRADVILDHEGGVPTGAGDPRLQDLDQRAPTTTSSSRSTPTPAAARASTSGRLRPRPQGRQPARRRRHRYARGVPRRRSSTPPTAAHGLHADAGSSCRRCEVRTVCASAVR